MGGLALSTSLGLSSCSDECSYTYTALTPIFTPISEVRSQPFGFTTGAQPMENPGKIYYYQNMLLINELGKGVHVFDNHDPANPTPVVFIEMPGNVDMAIRNDVLYLDSYIDLVSVDVSDWNQPKYMGRMEGLYDYADFPLANSQVWGWYNSYDETLVTGYEEELITIEDACGGGPDTWGGWMLFGGFALEMEFASADVLSVSPGGGSGQGGSMARFTMAANRLYAVDASFLHVVDISNPSAPNEVNEMSLDWGVETIFPYQDKLFLGTNSGMIITSIANPDQPEEMGRISHLVACDPVVVQGDLAYYTIRGGNGCGQAEDQLGVVDISDPYQPREIATYAMDQPFGLGIDGNSLFLCEGENGLKVFDASDARAIDDNLSQQFKNIHAWDVIPLGEVLLMVGQGGLYQYDYSDPDNLRLLSHIATN